MEVSESSWQMENALFHLFVPLRNHVTLLLSHKSSRLLSAHAKVAGIVNIKGLA